MNRENRQVRSVPSTYEIREDGEEYIIAGYFSVFNSDYPIWEGATESVDSHAFDDQLGEDVRCLIDHDTRLVLGRTKNGTLKLSVDERGLWGECKINKKDSEAVNLYERVKRGDVDQCSFGFEILEEDTEYREDGSVHWTIKRVRLHEVSVCTFPAYEETSVSARKRDLETVFKKQNEEWKSRQLEKLRELKSKALQKKKGDKTC